MAYNPTLILRNASGVGFDNGSLRVMRLLAEC